MRAPILTSASVLALMLFPPSAEAQLGRLKNMVAGVKKGEVYGVDVTEAGSPVVFVVDLTPVIELPPGAADNLKQMVAEEGEEYVRRRLAEEGPDWALRAAGPAGMVVREVMDRRNDRAERARNHVRAAIEGLDEDQRFGLVTFEGGPQAWRKPAAVASEANREEARDFLGRLQNVEGDGFLRSALMAAAGLSFDDAASGAAGMAPEEEDPSSAAMVGAVPAAMQAAMPVAAVPGASAGPPGSTVSAESLLQGIGLALELEPETIVVVVGAAPSEDPERFVARVADLAGGRDVMIHAAVFGEKQSGGVLRALAVANGGKLLTDDDEEE